MVAFRLKIEHYANGYYVTFYNTQKVRVFRDVGEIRRYLGGLSDLTWRNLAKNKPFFEGFSNHTIEQQVIQGIYKTFAQKYSKRAG